MSAETASRFRVPHTLVLLFGMIVLAYLLTLVLPAGSFERVENDHGREQVVPGTYQADADAERLPVWSILTAVPQGLSAAQEIIFFVFIVGGAFGVFRATGAVDAAIGGLLRTLGDRPAWLILGGLFVFAAGSSTIGMAEEYIPFVPLLVILCVGLGYDAVTAVAILCVGYGVGYGTATINPFTVLIAQEVAGLEPASGLWYRLVLGVAFFLLAFQHVYSYARKIRADPAASLMAGLPATGAAAEAEAQLASAEGDPELGAVEDEVDEAEEEVRAAASPHPPLTGRHWLILGITVALLAFLVVGIKAWGWYLIEMGAAFLGLALVLGLISRLGLDDTAKTFCTGAAELTTTALLIGFARGIQVVLDEGRVIDTIIQGIAQPLSQLGAAGGAVGMLFFQSLCNLFIPSGSGQAYVTMPVMAPLADLLEISRQVAVLAFQFGDGFTNILVPTNAVLVGILAIAGVPYDRWFRFVMPFMVKVWILASIALVVAVWIGY